MNIQLKSLKKEALFLFLCLVLTFTATIYFSSRRIAFYDFNFIANAVHRMSLGQMPYRDFDLVLPPITFLPIYFLHHFLTLSINTSILISTLATQAMSIISLQSILLRLLHGQSANLKKILFPLVMVTASLINVISIYPNYIYDSVASALALVSVSFLFRYLDTHKFSFLFLSQTIAILAFFTKFNMGGSLIIGFAMARIFVLPKKQQYKKLFIEVLTLATLFLVSLMAISLLGLTNFIEQTIIEPSRFKGVTKLGHLAQYNYPVLIVMVVAIVLALKIEFIRSRFTKYSVNFLALCLGLNLISILFAPLFLESFVAGVFPSANFAYPMVMLLGLHSLISLKGFDGGTPLLLATLPIYFFGTFLSQGWSGSSYSLFPLLCLLLVAIYLSLNNEDQLRMSAISISLVMLLSTSFLTMAVNGSRLGYVADNGVRGNSFNWEKIGIASSKEDISQASQIRQILDGERLNGTIVQFPAEDSLEQFSTELRPWGRCLQFTFICPTKSINVILDDFKNEVPDFVVIKKVTQINRDIEQIVSTLEPIIDQCFGIRYSNKIYSLYKAKGNSQACIRDALRTKHA